MPRPPIREEKARHDKLPGKEELLRQLLAIDDCDISWVVLAVLEARVAIKSALTPVLQDQWPGSAKRPHTGGSEDCLASAPISEQDNGATAHLLESEALGGSIDVSVESSDIQISTEFTNCSQVVAGHDSEKQSLLCSTPISSSCISPLLKKKPAPVVQFTAPIFYCAEQEAAGTGGAKVSLMRIAESQDIRTVVHFKTRDASAKAGRRYAAKSGSVVFEKGECFKQIAIEILTSTSWSATLEFSIELWLDDAEDATLGRYLRTCRVKVMDNDCFPTNRFEQQTKADRLEDIKQVQLLLEYFKMNLQCKSTRRAMAVAFLTCQFKNLYFILGLLTNLILLDHLICEDCGLNGQTYWKLVLIVLVMAIPFPLKHFLDFTQVRWKLAGTSRKLLQASLMRKFLNYNAESRHKVPESDLILAMTRDVPILVERGVMMLIPLLQSVTQLVGIVLWQLFMPQLKAALGEDSAQSGYVALLPMILTCILMVSFLSWRLKTTLVVQDTVDRRQNEMVDHVHMTVNNFRLIADFMQRPLFVDKMEEKVNLLNDAKIDEACVSLNNSYFAEWLTLVYVSCYTLYGSWQVSTGALHLGEFITNLAVFRSIGQNWGIIYDVLQELQFTLPSLMHIVYFMNLSTELHDRKVSQENADASLKALVEAACREPGALGNNPCYPAIVDNLPIELRDREMHMKTGNFEFTLRRCSASLKQGRVYAFIGFHGEGKSTMLRIIGGAVIPAPSAQGPPLFVPPHLRVLHVPAEPLFYQGSLYHNLIFGVLPGHEDGRMARVVEICQRLQLPANIIEEIQNTDQFHGEQYSAAHKQLLSIARALVANTEVICMHKPLLPFNAELTKVVIKSLRSFVRNRGVVQDRELIHMRRPRTCIITSRKFQAAMGFFDEVYEVSKKSGMIKLDPTAIQVDDQESKFFDPSKQFQRSYSTLSVT